MGTLYGTTKSGGNVDYGTIYKMLPDGTLTILFHFDGLNGRAPSSVVLGSDNNLYGWFIDGNLKAGIFKFMPGNAVGSQLTTVTARFPPTAKGFLTAGTGYLMASVGYHDSSEHATAGEEGKSGIVFSIKL